VGITPFGRLFPHIQMPPPRVPSIEYCIVYAKTTWAEVVQHRDIDEGGAAVTTVQDGSVEETYKVVYSVVGIRSTPLLCISVHPVSTQVHCVGRFSRAVYLEPAPADFMSPVSQAKT
jgi:hypothetical protein